MAKPTIKIIPRTNVCVFMRSFTKQRPKMTKITATSKNGLAESGLDTPESGARIETRESFIELNRCETQLFTLKSSLMPNPLI